jgi:hypothetical protein
VYADFGADVHINRIAGILSSFSFPAVPFPGHPATELNVASFVSKSGGLKHYIAVPLWKSGDSSRKLHTTGDSQEANIELAANTFYVTDLFNNDYSVAEDPNLTSGAPACGNDCRITWEGFNATSSENVYGLKLLDNKIEWYAGDISAPIPLRATVHSTTSEDIYPNGPCP